MKATAGVDVGVIGLAYELKNNVEKAAKFKAAEQALRNEFEEGLISIQKTRDVTGLLTLRSRANQLKSLQDEMEKLKRMENMEETGRYKPVSPSPLPHPCNRCHSKTVSANRNYCLDCYTFLSRTLSSGFCPACAAKILDHHLHPTTGPAYYDWLLKMLNENKDCDTGHKLQCPDKHLIMRSDRPMPEINNRK
jgi:hypothetical protein